MACRPRSAGNDRGAQRFPAIRSAAEAQRAIKTARSVTFFILGLMFLIISSWTGPQDTRSKRCREGLRLGNEGKSSDMYLANKRTECSSVSIVDTVPSSPMSRMRAGRYADPALDSEIMKSIDTSSHHSPPTLLRATQHSTD